MAVTKGFVTRTSENGLADFVPQEKTECGNCSSMHSCGIGSQRKILATGVLNKAGADVGDFVTVSIKSSKLLTSIAVIYLIPAIGLLLGAVAGANLFNVFELDETTSAIIFSLVGLALGVLLAFSISRKLSESNQFKPEITKILKSNPNPSKNRTTELSDPDTPPCLECVS